MKVLFASAELTPMAKVGGLADVSYSLPMALNRLGLDVRVIIPFYSSLLDKNYKTKKIGKTHSVRLGEINVEFELRTISEFPLKVYLIDCPHYFRREGIYGSKREGIYEDNEERYTFFCKAVVKSLESLRWRPDILQSNDWQSSLIPILLKDTEYSGTGTLLTIHNLVFQGVLEWDMAARLGLAELPIDKGKVDFYGRFNMLKTGILTADKLNTVSPGYRDETLTGGALGAGLEDVLKEREDDYSGIINGIDYEYWNPAEDEYLEVKYKGNWKQFKSRNKLELLKQCDFENINPERPLLGFVGRLSDQKGIELIIKSIDDIISTGSYLIILGSGEEGYENTLRILTNIYPDSVFYNSTFNEPMAHLIYAGSNIFLMPSKYEPCGISQMIAMHYGTIPVIRDVGGLRDSVSDYNSKIRGGTGFKFIEYSPDEMMIAIERALEVYLDNSKWNRLVNRAVKEDFTWECSAKVYKNLYTEILK